jgi:hypothetical protein
MNNVVRWALMMRTGPQQRATRLFHEPYSLFHKVDLRLLLRRGLEEPWKGGVGQSIREE